MLLALLAIGFLVLGTLEAWRDSPTYDEPVYVSSGLATLLSGDLSLNDEHPPLAKVLAVLPVLLVHPVMPSGRALTANDEHAYSAEFVRAQIAAGKLRAVDFAARIVPLLESVALALLLYALANDLFGGYAGLLSAALWLASPLVLGLGHLDGVDLPFSLAVAGFSWALLRWVRCRRARRLVVLGIAAAIAALTNASGLLIVALGALLVPALELSAPDRQPLGKRARRSMLAGIAFAMSALGVIWMVYVALNPSVLWAGLGLLPHPYLEGLRYLAHHDSASAPTYLDGVAWTGGRWWYWPLSLAIKLPPATLGVLVLGPLAWLGLDRAKRREAALVTVLPAILLFSFDLTLSRDIGVRYLLPVLSLWLVAASAAANTSRTILIRVALAASVVLGVWSAASSYPDSLAWTSPLFGPSYRVATNSSVDWGQDFFRLQSWDRVHSARVAYFGPRGLTAAGTGHTRPLVGVPPAQITGWVAASATDLTTLHSLSWLRAYCPVERLGGTILIYRFTHPPSAEPGPSEPAPPCRGTASYRP
ncbi:MAG: glycosyltransferase family 39 protein [Solirubrobacteraceae bacterium]